MTYSICCYLSTILLDTSMYTDTYISHDLRYTWPITRVNNLKGITCLTGMGTRRQWPRPRRDRDVSLTSRDETETKRLQVSRRDRDVETHIVFNAVQVNVGLTTVATVTACLLVLGCIPDFCVLNSNDFVHTVFMPLQPVGTGRWKNELYHSLLLKVIMLHKYWDGCARAPPTLVVKTTFLSEKWRTAVT